MPGSESSEADATTAMLRRAVRFHEENEEYSNSDTVSPSPPRTPSPSFSATSISPHSSPSTPPPFTYPSRIHDLKQFSPHSAPYVGGGLHVELSHDTQVTFDFSYSPDDPRNDLSVSMPSSSLEARATDAPFLRIGCYLLPWIIEILPTPGHTHITVSDVLVGIYDALQRSTTKVELLRETPLKQQQVTDRCARRVKDQTDKSPKRIDWLPMEKRQFLGLSELPGGNGAYAWTLKVDE
ncbi:hypothetical protein FPV67DRAFT_1116829 [Lyophyllum atratum]|nr:hypothetical protein FPV67DRAFT_1116829 [Lyophyllum atratum]